MAKEMVFDRIGRIKAPVPWKDQNIKDVIWVHIHRYPVDGEVVSPYYGLGANWMFSGSLGRWSSLAQKGCLSRRRKTLILNLCCLAAISSHGKGFRSKP